MSRTKRKGIYEHDHSYYKEIGDCDNLKDSNGRDKKNKQKPAGWWKRLRRRMRRNKEKAALRNGKQVPQFKRCDMWEWN